ncbi:MAG: Crp/Fnr family transcriptional regulator [Thiolinea sp.]
MDFQQFILSNGQLLSLQSGSHVFRQGEADKYFYVVKSGLLKAYYLSDDGKENIKSFILPGDKIGSLMAAYAKQHCTFSLVCLQPSELIAVEFAAIYMASRNDPQIAAEMTDFLLAFAMKKEKREYELLCLSAEERYLELMRTTPELFDRVTQNEIALYLGITPVGLSRIKKRIQITGNE